MFSEFTEYLYKYKINTLDLVQKVHNLNCITTWLEVTAMFQKWLIWLEKYVEQYQIVNFCYYLWNWKRKTTIANAKTTIANAIVEVSTTIERAIEKRTHEST